MESAAYENATIKIDPTLLIVEDWMGLDTKADRQSQCDFDLTLTPVVQLERERERERERVVESELSES
jgi:hypothetical protein